ncbi:hypothetical protein J6A31_06590 [bacterium]|nr:hypothetical protein [bacterium]
MTETMLTILLIVSIIMAVIAIMGCIIMTILEIKHTIQSQPIEIETDSMKTLSFPNQNELEKMTKKIKRIRLLSMLLLALSIIGLFIYSYNR